MWSRARASFSRSSAAAPAPSEEALLAQLSGQLDADALAPFRFSSELPSGDCPAEQRALLLRYFRAEKLDVAAAAARIVRQAAWRKHWAAVTEEDVAAELASGKVKLQPPCGSCPHPLLIVKACKHRPGATPQALNQFIYYCLEAASHYAWAAPDGKLVAVFDLAGLQLKNLDAAALRASFHMLAEHFPERMASVWMLEAPTIFWGIWKLVEPFIDRTARKNIHFVYGAAAREALLKELGPEILPLEYGGAAAEVTVEAAVQQLPAWQQRRQQQRGAAEEGAAAVQQGEAAAPQPAAASSLPAVGSLRLSESASVLAAPV